MAELIICRGIPASGKSTWAKNWVRQDEINRREVSRDGIRWEKYHKYWGLSQDEENFVTSRELSRIRGWLEAGISVVVHDTNLNASTVRKILAVGQQCFATIEHVDFPIDIDLAIARDNMRQKKVGEDVIRNFSDRYIKKGKFPPFPEPPAPIDFKKYEPNPDLPVAWMCDIDGTMALLNGRSPYDESRVLSDRINWPVRAAVLALSKATNADGVAKRIIFMSGRTEACRKDTEQWLRDLDIGDTWLLEMRQIGDRRPDPVVKHELFYRHVAPKFWVQGVFDDRDRVVKMWRDIGLTCFQVNYGDF